MYKEVFLEKLFVFMEVIMIPQCHLLVFISTVCFISAVTEEEETALKQTRCNYPAFASRSILHMNMKREEEAVLFHLPNSLYSDVLCQFNRTML